MPQRHSADLNTSHLGAPWNVYIAYCLSGFISLSYQVAWFRITVDRFGSTNLTFVLVLCNFIAGLGVGAMLSRPTSEWLSRLCKLQSDLRVYGVVELLVSATVLFTLLCGLIPAETWGHFPYDLREGIYRPTLTYQISKAALASASVFVPCFFMGVTFPLLCHVYSSDGRFPSKLYAWNTLGAGMGVLLCQFVLLDWIGHNRLLLLMAGLNALLGAYFLIAGDGCVEDSAPDVGRAPVDRQNADLPVTSAAPEGQSTGTWGLLVTCALLSGFLSGALEADMFRRVRFLGGYSNSAMSFVSFWAILAIFLGSVIVRTAAQLRLWHLKFAYLAAFLIYLATWSSLGMMEETSLSRLLMFSGVVVFPTYFLISTLLPYVCNRMQAEGKHLGVLYGLNTLAFCLGMVVFTWGAPRINLFYSFKLFLLTFGTCVVLLSVLFERQAFAASRPLLAMGVFVFGCFVTPSAFDPAFFPVDQPPRHFPVSAMKSNGSYTTFVLDDPIGRRLFFDSHSMSSVSPGAQTYMRLMAHFPLLAQQDPREALLICYGCGNTASAIALHESIENIDVVDLNDQVFATAPEFADVTQSVHLDPRIRFIHDDGRNFLNVTDRKYDLITSEPPPPMYSGVYRLYSREYYEQVRNHLTDAGMMTQWLPVYQMPPKAVSSAIATFLAVFPQTLLFTGMGEEFILLGGNTTVDLKLLRKQFTEQRAVREELRSLQILSPTSLLARLVKGDATLRREYAMNPVISDQHNDFATQFATLTHSAHVTYDPLALFDDFADQPQSFDAETQAVIRHLGRLNYHVRGFPWQSLTVIPPESAGQVALSRVDWQKWSDYRQQSQLLAAERDALGAIELLNDALALADEQPLLNQLLANYYLATSQFDRANDHLHRFAALEPRVLRGDVLPSQPLSRTGNRPPESERYYMAGLLLKIRGKYDSATKSYRKAIELKPNFAAAHNNLGTVLELLDDRELAVDHFQKALQLDPDLPQAMENLKRATGT